MLHSPGRMEATTPLPNFMMALVCDEDRLNAPFAPIFSSP